MTDQHNNFGERPRAPTLAERQAIIQRAEQKKRKLERLKRGSVGGRP